jgi:hypothetical protein
MSIFREIAELIYEVAQEDYEHNKKILEERRRLEEIKRYHKNKLEQERLEQERLERQVYWDQLYDDPTSVMICPFGWSPFGIYL